MFNLTYSHFATAYRQYAALDKAGLAASLGWSAFSGNSGAVLTSLALLAAGAPLSGNVRITAGPFAGRSVCNEGNRLADWLGERFATPEVLPFSGSIGDVSGFLFGKRGIVAFVESAGGPWGGDIRLLDNGNAGVLCCAAQSRHTSEVRFWPLN